MVCWVISLKKKIIKNTTNNKALQYLCLLDLLNRLEKRWKYNPWVPHIVAIVNDESCWEWRALAEECRLRSDYGCGHQQVLIPLVPLTRPYRSLFIESFYEQHAGEQAAHAHLICASHPAVLLCSGRPLSLAPHGVPLRLFQEFLHLASLLTAHCPLACTVKNRYQVRPRINHITPRSSISCL